MLFDETSPTLKYFQKPIFGKKTLLKNPDGSRTAVSTALTAGLAFLGGMSAFGPEPAKALDRLIQGGPAPKYLTDQEWYQNNVDASDAKANAIGAITGGIGEATAGVVKTVAGVLTGGASNAALAGTKAMGDSLKEIKPLKPIGQSSPVDPKIKFNEMLKSKAQALTPDQRIQQEQKTKSQMQYFPQGNTGGDEEWRFYSDTAPVFGKIPNFLGNFSNKP